MPGAKKSGAQKKLIVAGIVLVVMVVAGYGAIHFTSGHEFCASCHVMKKPVEAWAASSHKEVECLGCHTDGTLIGYAKVKLQGIDHVISVATGDTKHYRKPEVNHQACVKCHEDGLQESKRYDHKERLEKGTSCTNCHAKNFHNL